MPVQGRVEERRKQKIIERHWEFAVKSDSLEMHAPEKRIDEKCAI